MPRGSACAAMVAVGGARLAAWFVAARVAAFGGAVRWAAALLGRANLIGLVLGFIEAKFCKKICV